MFEEQLNEILDQMLVIPYTGGERYNHSPEQFRKAKAALIQLIKQREQEVREEIVEKTFKRKKSDMRKEVAIILAREGYTYRQIAKLLGVSSTRSVSIYLNGYTELSTPTDQKEKE